MSKADHGAYAASITPINASGEPCGERLIEHCHWLMGQGMTGVAPLGTTGEGNSLPLSFRLDVPGLFRDAGFTSNKVIFGTGSCSTGDAIAATRAVVDAGFTNALVLPPFYYKNVSEDGVFDYFDRLINGVGTDTLRVYLYHFPKLSMTPITVSLIKRLKAEFGSVIAGLKDSSGDFEGTLEFVKAASDFDVFPGSESVLVEGLQKGCVGSISATSNASASLTAATLAACGSQAADGLQETLSAVRFAIADYPLSSALKQIEAWRRNDDSWRAVLAPNTVLTDAQCAKLRESLEALEPAAGVLEVHPTKS
jgi:4-hydroxy-tetrahydrodipicolinate synthase